jgi:hypothetical protein
MALMDAVDAVRAQLWAGRGGELLGPIAYLDTDGPIAPTRGEHKAGMDIWSSKGIWGYAPLIGSRANTKDVLSLVNRRGDAPSHHGAAQWMDRAVDLVAPHPPRVCLRRGHRLRADRTRAPVGRAGA